MESLAACRCKAELRRRCLRWRKQVDADKADHAAAAVCAHVVTLPEFAAARLVHVYLASLTNELDTSRVIAVCWSCGKQVVAPVVRPDSCVLGHAIVAAGETLVRGRWGLLGPPLERTRWLDDLGAIDLVLVPGVAFDRRGRRLGMGGGYYDRFLTPLRATRVGLTYDELLLDEIPAESHDVRMDAVVAPAGVLRCHGDRA